MQEAHSNDQALLILFRELESHDDYFFQNRIRSAIFLNAMPGQIRQKAKDKNKRHWNWNWNWNSTFALGFFFLLPAKRRRPYRQAPGAWPKSNQYCTQ
jgi:hypothetical protein